MISDPFPGTQPKAGRKSHPPLCINIGSPHQGYPGLSSMGSRAFLSQGVLARCPDQQSSLQLFVCQTSPHGRILTSELSVGYCCWKKLSALWIDSKFNHYRNYPLHHDITISSFLLLPFFQTQVSYSFTVLCAICWVTPCEGCSRSFGFHWLTCSVCWAKEKRTWLHLSHFLIDKPWA